MLRDPDTGRRVSRANRETEWVRVEVPELRIVSEELWSNVQQTRRLYKGKAAQNCRRPKRLLSGLLTCGECGGSFSLVRPGKYGCAAHREKGTCTNASQISVNQLEGRVLAGIKMRLLNPELVVEFIHEFHSELMSLQKASTEVESHSKKRLDEIRQKIARIVSAIAEGTDTPTLRQTLISLEGERAELEKTVGGYRRPLVVEPPPPPDLALLFRRKVERLEETLNAEPDVITKAAPILRTLIDGIVLHPRKKRGTMPIEVYGEPSALFLMADEEPASPASRMITVVAEERYRLYPHLQNVCYRLRSSA
jgi:site-specific DNA recombinase